MTEAVHKVAERGAQMLGAGENEAAREAIEARQ
jgi:hypothetical protein